MTDARYLDDHDALVALISHLGLVSYKSRTAPFIASATGLDEAETRRVLDGFPGLFRKSRATSREGERYYTLQMRYAAQAEAYKSGAEDAEVPPLNADHILALIDFVSHNAQREQDSRLAENALAVAKGEIEANLELTKQGMEDARRASETAKRAAIVAAIVAAAGAVAAAIID